MHIAILSPAFPSHVAAAEAVAAALVARGHRLTLVQRPEVAAWLDPDSPLGFAPLPGGGEALDRVIARAARPGFPFGIRQVVRDTAQAAREMALGAPDVLGRIGAGAAIVDQMAPGGAVAAERLGLPYVSVAAALPVEEEPALPLPMLGWRYDSSPRGLKRNAGGVRIADVLLRPLHDTLSEAGREPRRRLAEWISPLASLWQLVPGLDFPRSAMPATAHYVGPLRRPDDAGSALPFDLPSERPVAYASLGTLQGDRLRLFRRIARACRRSGIFLVVSHCGRLAQEEAATIGADVVVADLDQRAMVARANVVVTHAGLNTVLDAAAAGVPVLAFPIAFDQPGTAARVAFSGLGRELDHRLATSGAIARALADLIEDRRHRDAAGRLAGEIARAGGAERAAEIVEKALVSRRPVLRPAA